MKILMKIDRKDLYNHSLKRASKKSCGSQPVHRETEKLSAILKLVKK